jgi:hypothetical protein
MPAREAEQAEQVWHELQSDLANLSSNSRVLVAKKKWAQHTSSPTQGGD